MLQTKWFFAVALLAISAQGNTAKSWPVTAGPKVVAPLKAPTIKTPIIAVPKQTVQTLEKAKAAQRESTLAPAQKIIEQATACKNKVTACLNGLFLDYESSPHLFDLDSSIMNRCVHPECGDLCPLENRETVLGYLARPGGYSRVVKCGYGSVFFGAECNPDTNFPDVLEFPPGLDSQGIGICYAGHPIALFSISNSGGHRCSISDFMASPINVESPQAWSSHHSPAQLFVDGKYIYVSQIDFHGDSCVVTVDMR